MLIRRTASGHRIGETHHRAKLTDEQVEKIRNLYATGTIGYVLLGRAFRVSPWTIRDIVKEWTR